MRAHLLDVLDDLGFARSCPARLLGPGVTVADVRRWLAADAIPADRHAAVGDAAVAVAAVCATLGADDAATWMENRIHPDSGATPLDVRARAGLDALVDLARGRISVAAALDATDPDWRTRDARGWEVFRAGDGHLSIRATSTGALPAGRP